MNVCSATQRKADQTGSNGVIAHLVDEDEAAKTGTCIVGLKHEGTGEREIAIADLIHVKLTAGDMVEVLDADFVFELANGRRSRLSAEANEIGSTWQHRFIAEPDHMRRHLVGEAWVGTSCGDHITSPDVDLILKHD